MSVKNAIITAAGFGTRFLPAVKEIPKEMLPIINKPIIQLVVEECIDAGVENIVIVVREGNEIIRSYFKREANDVKNLLESVGKQDRFKSVEEVLSISGIEVVNQRDDLPYGNGSPVLSAKDYIPEGEPVAVLFADDLVLTNGKGAIGQLIDHYNEGDGHAVIAGQRVASEEIHKYGIIKPKGDPNASSGEVEYIVEKPSHDDAPSDIVTYGRYVLPYKIFEILENLQTGLDNELWLPDANSKIAEEGKLEYMVVNGEWFTTGDPLAYLETVIRFYLKNPDFSDKTRKLLSRLQQ